MRKLLSIVAFTILATGCNRPDHIEIEQKEVVLKHKNERVVLLGRLKSRRGTDFPDKLPTWESADPNVASIDKEFGLVAGKSGRTMAIAKYDDLRAEVPVEVRLVEELRVEPKELTLPQDAEEATQLNVTVLGLNQKVLTDRTIRYTSSNEKVATIDGGGGIWAQDPGEATVKVFCDDKETAITVKVAAAKGAAKKK